jgi:biotin carboxylase
LLGKIIVWAPTRTTAIRRAERALKETDIRGIKTTTGLLQKLVSLPDFEHVKHHTKYIETVVDLTGGAK